MDILVEFRKKTAIARIRGAMDAFSSSEIEDQLAGLLQNRYSLIMDMTEVSSISTEGFLTMLLLYRHAAAKNIRVRLFGLSDEIEDTFRITGYERFFIIKETLDQCLAADGEGSQ